MTPAIVEKKKYTYEDYLKTPDDKRYELIGGDLLVAPSPVPNHQRISRKIEFILEKFVTQNNLGEIFDAPCDVYLDDENVVQPDILFIAHERRDIIGEKNIQGAPDLAVEIISENSAYRDVVQKKRLYARFGVKEYWIVIPESEEIEVYILKNNTYQLYKIYSRGGILESPMLKGLNIELKEIF
ncbi:MAG: restriction endonuclease [Planctomycetes bacterium GWB2_41_19]|nr:MAG: restriction endonuclease [Planctomycetes bacterium GWB2_41_19]